MNCIKIGYIPIARIKLGVEPESTWEPGEVICVTLKEAKHRRNEYRNFLRTNS